MSKPPEKITGPDANGLRQLPMRTCWAARVAARLHRTPMSTSDVLLFNSGRFPLWFRLPALAFGLFALWLAVGIAAHGLFGLSLGLPLSGIRGSLLFGSLGCLAIAAIWILIWFAQFQILFGASRHELIVRTRGYFRSDDRRISLAGSREVHIRQVRCGFASRTWKVSVEYCDGRSEQVTAIPRGIKALAESLEAVTKLPVKRYDYGA